MSRIFETQLRERSACLRFLGPVQRPAITHHHEYSVLYVMDQRGGGAHLFFQRSHIHPLQLESLPHWRQSIHHHPQFMRKRILHFRALGIILCMAATQKRSERLAFDIFFLIYSGQLLLVRADYFVRIGWLKPPVTLLLKDPYPPWSWSCCSAAA